MALNSSSVSIVTPSFCALSSLEPGESPVTTKSVFARKVSLGNQAIALVKARRAEICIAQGAGAPKGRLNPGWPATGLAKKQNNRGL